MNEEELLDAEIQKRKRRFLIVLLCFVFVSFGGVLLISPERLTPTEAAAITAQAGVDETAAGIVSESETPAVDIDTSGEIEEQLSPTEEIVGGTGGGTQPGSEESIGAETLAPDEATSGGTSDRGGVPQPGGEEVAGTGGDGGAAGEVISETTGGGEASAGQEIAGGTGGGEQEQTTGEGAAGDTGAQASASEEETGDTSKVDEEGAGGTGDEIGTGEAGGESTSAEEPSAATTGETTTATEASTEVEGEGVAGGDTATAVETETSPETAIPEQELATGETDVGESTVVEFPKELPSTGTNLNWRLAPIALGLLLLGVGASAVKR